SICASGLTSKERIASARRAAAGAIAKKRVFAACLVERTATRAKKSIVIAGRVVIPGPIPKKCVAITLSIQESRKGAEKRVTGPGTGAVPRTVAKKRVVGTGVSGACADASKRVGGTCNA